MRRADIDLIVKGKTIGGWLVCGEIVAVMKVSQENT